MSESRIITTIDASLSETFGVPTISELVPVEEKPMEVVESESDDFEFVRRKLHSLLHEGTTAFETLAVIAKSEEKISAFTALNEMMNNLSEISVKLLDIQEKKQKLNNTKTDNKNPTTITNNNIAFIGTTADLSKLLNDDSLYGETIDNDE